MHRLNQQTSERLVQKFGSFWTCWEKLGYCYESKEAYDGRSIDGILLAITRLTSLLIHKGQISVVVIQHLRAVAGARAFFRLIRLINCRKIAAWRWNRPHKRRDWLTVYGRKKKVKKVKIWNDSINTASHLQHYYHVIRNDSENWSAICADFQSFDSGTVSFLEVNHNLVRDLKKLTYGTPLKDEILIFKTLTFLRMIKIL